MLTPADDWFSIIHERCYIMIVKRTLALIMFSSPNSFIDFFYRKIRGRFLFRLAYIALNQFNRAPGTERLLDCYGGLIYMTQICTYIEP